MPVIQHTALPSRRASVLLRLPIATLPALILSVLSIPAHSATLVAAASPASPAGALSFDDGFFPSNSGIRVDLSRFEKANALLPGTYLSDVTLNGDWRARTQVTLVDMPGTDTPQPCYDAAALTQFGIDLDRVTAQTENPPEKAIPAKGPFCGPLGDYVPGATAHFDGGSQSLALSVPQIYLSRHALDYVDPSQWDEGINAGLISYNGNLYRSMGGGSQRTGGYIGINAAANFGSWHAVHLSSWSWNQSDRNRYQTSANYLQHDIPTLKAQVQVGDLYTSGNLFDSVNLRGVRIFTDDRMLPQSLRGYAPIVRGIAETNARVVIKQRGFPLRDITVAPGPFTIDDLYPTGYGGDLEVEVQEADGRIKRFSVPFSASPQLLRAGQHRLEVTAGKLTQERLKNTPFAMQGTYQFGVSNKVTTYGGATLASGYLSALVGGALNTNLGAFSLDLTQSRTHLSGQPTEQGTSLRAGYNKNVTQTGTNFTLGMYRYSTSGYRSLSDVALLRDAMTAGESTYSLLSLRLRTRSQVSASIYQTLGSRYGQVFLTGARRDYWGNKGRQVDFTAGYSNSWRSITYSFSAQRTRDSLAQNGLPYIGPINEIPGAPGSSGLGTRTTRRDTRLLFTATMPLGTTPNAPSMTGLFNRSDLIGNNYQASVNGTALADNRLSYNATLGRNEGGDRTVSLLGQYNGGHGNVQASYSQGSAYKQASAGISGGLVLHEGGFTWSPPVGETVGLVHAPGAAGARIVANQRSVVDKNNYAVVPNLIPYVRNTVALDPKDMPTSTELQESSQNVAPRARTVVLLNYKTVSGRVLLIDSLLPNGEPLPFGADVLDASGQNVGVTGQASRVFVRGVDSSTDLTVRWGPGDDARCRIHVELQPQPKGVLQTDYEKLDAVCIPGSTQGTPMNSSMN